MAEDDAAWAPQVLICDRDRKWSVDVWRRLQDAAIRVILIAEREPNANAMQNALCGRSKKNVSTGLIPLAERQFWRAVAEYVAHYHGERNHQGLDNHLISGPPVIEMTSRVRRRPRLGGLLNFYERPRERRPRHGTLRVHEFVLAA